jgi:hypothetical protein
MPPNSREGMRRLGIVVSVLGSVAGGIRGYFLAADTYALSAHGFRRESVLVDYAIASLLPVLGFWLPWEVMRFLDWISSGVVRTAHGAAAPHTARSTLNVPELRDKLALGRRRSGRGAPGSGKQESEWRTALMDCLNTALP